MRVAHHQIINPTNPISQKQWGNNVFPRIKAVIIKAASIDEHGLAPGKSDKRSVTLAYVHKNCPQALRSELEIPIPCGDNKHKERKEESLLGKPEEFPQKESQHEKIQARNFAFGGSGDKEIGPGHRGKKIRNHYGALAQGSGQRKKTSGYA
jgi:hypothetical protein